MTRISIIDLGTNTFNLLIADISSDKKFTIVYNTKVPVKLGEGGINKNFIAPPAFERGLNALEKYSQLIAEYKSEKQYSFATSAIREASNGKEFVQKVKELFNIDVQVISGDREAELIYYGVRKAAQLTNEKSLIIDIGGGSTEFIIANKNQIFWKQSFLLGASRLLEKFHPSDPIKEAETNSIKQYLKEQLKPLADALKKYPVTELIGSSGSFESLADMIAYRFYDIKILDNKTEFDFNLDDCNIIYEELLKSTKQERMQMKGLIEMRVDMIVVSSIIVHFVITEFEISKMRLSTYALKEGVIEELLKNQ